MGFADQLNTYLTLSGILFAIGTFGFLARRNAISMLMSIELMLNAVNLSIVAFGAFVPALQGDGAVIALMVMAVAAAGDGRAWRSSSRSSGTARRPRRRVRRDAPMRARGGARRRRPDLPCTQQSRSSRCPSPASCRRRSSGGGSAGRLLDPGRRGGPVVARRRRGDQRLPRRHLRRGGARRHAVALIPAGDFVVDVGFFVDNLTAVLLIVVTTIGMLVHVYSIGYMRHDPATGASSPTSTCSWSRCS